MIIEHFIIAQNSSVDRDTNNFSIFNIIEDIMINSSIGNDINIPVQAIVVLKRENERGPINDQLNLTVTKDNNNIMPIQPISYSMLDEHRRQRVRINFSVRFNGTGVYEFTVTSTNDANMSRTLSIRVDFVN